MRNLASIQKIISLEQIPGKDKIELATVLGWHVIVEKSKYKVGDLVIYCEVDSILPELPEFEFLRARCSSKKYQGFRIRTLKFGQTISQGIVFPTSILTSHTSRKIEEGMDVTDYLKITKYDPEAWSMEKETHKRGRIMVWFMKWAWFRWIWRKMTWNDKPKKAAWPEFISKTDETRIQAVPSVVEEYRNVHVYATEKMDGQSSSFAIDADGSLIVCSRNLWLKTETDSNWWKVARKYNMLEVLKSIKKQFNLDVILQGEICGPGIQQNKYGFTEPMFFLFSITDRATGKYVPFSIFMGIAEFIKLTTVPILGVYFQLSTIGETVDALVEYSKGESVMAKGVKREGVVIRSVTGEPYNVRGIGTNFSFKVINPEFLLKYEEA